MLHKLGLNSQEVSNTSSSQMWYIITADKVFRRCEKENIFRNMCDICVVANDCSKRPSKKMSSSLSSETSCFLFVCEKESVSLKAPLRLFS